MSADENKVDGEYDRPLAERIDNPTTADYDKLKKLLEKYHRDDDKVAVYEAHIEDMLNAIQERLDELSGKDLDDFEKGRRLAFIEMFDIIKTRHQIIWDVLSADSADCSIDCYDPYISGYFFLQSVQEHRPLTEEEQARFERCAQEMQKRRELREFDRWLEESFGTKIDSVPPSSDLFDD